MIRSRNGKFELVSSRGKVLGRHRSKVSALKQERAIKASQNRRKK